MSLACGRAKLASGSSMPLKNVRRGVPHHTFDIEGPNDPKELIKELEAKGIKVDDTRLHGEGPGYSVYVIDPSGNRLELSKD